MHPLPTSVEAVARVIGEPLALRLTALATHRQLYVPLNAASDHPLVQAIGPLAYSALRKEFGGQLIPFARCRPDSRGAARVRAIKAALMAGVLPHAVAQQFGVSARRVQQILSMACLRHNP
jgi:hypothetical protein